MQPKNYNGLMKGWTMIQTWSQGGLWYLWRYKGFYIKKKWHMGLLYGPH